MPELREEFVLPPSCSIVRVVALLLFGSLVPQPNLLQGCVFDNPGNGCDIYLPVSLGNHNNLTGRVTSAKLIAKQQTAAVTR